MYPTYIPYTLIDVFRKINSWDYYWLTKVSSLTTYTLYHSDFIRPFIVHLHCQRNKRVFFQKEISERQNSHFSTFSRSMTCVWSTHSNYCILAGRTRDEDIRYILMCTMKLKKWHLRYLKICFTIQSVM